MDSMTTFVKMAMSRVAPRSDARCCEGELDPAAQLSSGELPKQIQ